MLLGAVGEGFGVAFRWVRGRVCGKRWERARGWWGQAGNGTASPCACVCQNDSLANYPWFSLNWNRVWGRGCDAADTSQDKRLFIKSVRGIQSVKASLRNAAGKAIQ